MYGIIQFEGENSQICNNSRNLFLFPTKLICRILGKILDIIENIFIYRIIWIVQIMFLVSEVK